MNKIKIYTIFTHLNTKFKCQTHFHSKIFYSKLSNKTFCWNWHIFLENCSIKFWFKAQIYYFLVNSVNTYITIKNYFLKKLSLFQQLLFMKKANNFSIFFHFQLFLNYHLNSLSFLLKVDWTKKVNLHNWSKLNAKKIVRDKNKQIFNSSETFLLASSSSLINY